MGYAASRVAGLWHSMLRALQCNDCSDAGNADFSKRSNDDAGARSSFSPVASSPQCAWWCSRTHCHTPPHCRRHARQLEVSRHQLLPPWPPVPSPLPKRGPPGGCCQRCQLAWHHHYYHHHHHKLLLPSGPQQALHRVPGRSRLPLPACRCCCRCCWCGAQEAPWRGLAHAGAAHTRAWR